MVVQALDALVQLGRWRPAVRARVRCRRLVRLGVPVAAAGDAGPHDEDDHQPDDPAAAPRAATAGRAACGRTLRSRAWRLRSRRRRKGRRQRAVRGRDRRETQRAATGVGAGRRHLLRHATPAAESCRRREPLGTSRADGLLGHRQQPGHAPCSVGVPRGRRGIIPCPRPGRTAGTSFDRNPVSRRVAAQRLSLAGLIPVGVNSEWPKAIGSRGRATIRGSSAVLKKL